MEFKDVENLLLYIGFSKSINFYRFEGIISGNFYSISILDSILLMDNIEYSIFNSYPITYIDVVASHEEKYEMISMFFKHVIRKKKIKLLLGYGI